MRKIAVKPKKVTKAQVKKITVKPKIKKAILKTKPKAGTLTRVYTKKHSALFTSTVNIPVPVKPTEVLRAGARHMEDRASQYDRPEGERSMDHTVKMFNILTGHNLTETEGWKFMALLKLVRASTGPFKLDNYEDLTAYGALAAESHSVGK